MLAHELAHLARRDPAWQSAAMLACAVLWWQPLSWWSSRRLRAASEAAADEASMLLPDGPSQLAASLVSLAQRLTDPQIATRHIDAGQRIAIGPGTPGGAALEALKPAPSAAPSKPRLALAHAALPIVFFDAVHPLYGLGTFSTFFYTRGHDGECTDECVAQLACGNGDVDGPRRRNSPTGR